MDPQAPRAIDLFAGAGGVSVGLARAGFHVTAVDANPKVRDAWLRGMERYAPPELIGEHITADALEVPLDGHDFIWASPPCQAFSVATRITGRHADHPDLVAATRGRLEASGTLYAIENVPGSPLGGKHPLVLLCGSMFGLQTPDGRAEIRRHRWFELSWPVLFRPQCQHGGAPESLSVFGHEATVWSADRRTLSVVGAKGLPGLSHKRRTEQEKRRVLCVAGGKAMSGGMMTPQGTLKRRAMTVAGHYPQTNLVRNQVRETFSVDDARAAMGIDWMPMKFLSQAIPPAYASWIGEQARLALAQK